MTLQQLRALAEEKRATVIAKRAKKDLLEEQLTAQETLAAALKDQALLLEKVQTLLQKTSEYARQQARGRIEEIVTSALTVVFGEGYRFRIDLVTRANRVEADYYLQSGELETQLSQPDFGRGGGVIDVITLALRLAILELSGNKGPVFLDEIGKMVSAEYAENVAYFLKEYSQRFGRQIILITHNEKLMGVGDKTFRVTQKNGESVVSEG